MQEHPDLGDPVVLRDGAGREYASRVADRGTGLLVVVQPRDLPEGEELGSGTELSVTWADAEGVVTVLPTRVLTAREDGPLPVWSLVVTGAAVHEQRRRFARVPVEGPVQVRPAEGGPKDVVTGALVDVGEGGVRCRVAAGAADRFLAGPHQVVAEFTLDGVAFAVPGSVEFLRPTARPADLEDLVVVFDEPVADAAALSKAVFAEEARALEEPVEGDH